MPKVPKVPQESMDSPSPHTSNTQLSLFSVSEARSLDTWGSLNTADSGAITLTTLQTWKKRVYNFQRQVRSEPPPQQQTLFAPEISYTQNSIDPDRLDPFQLPRQNINFWRWKVSDSGEAALYFVIDYHLPLLLYVGETVKSNQRWKGEHDCKRYLSQYRQAHYDHQQDTQLGIAFLRGAPSHYKARQRLELSLIQRWRSPFNKENWTLWGTPFVG
ncbi:MAG: GIY-YIG nuclease family protein [Prochlorotrichaceae cyanobacterium]